MAERDTERMTEWLDIKLDTLSSEERIRLIEEVFDDARPARASQGSGFSGEA